MKRKFIVSVLFLLLCQFSVMPGKYAQAKTIHLTGKAVATVKGKYAFIGDFTDDTGEIYLHILKTGKKYTASYRQFRLAQMDLKGTVKNGILKLHGTDPAGKPITITLSRKGSKWKLTFKKTTWEYFTQGSTVPLKKSYSGNSPLISPILSFARPYPC